MPQYEFQCKESLGGCGHTFLFTCPMSQLDEKKPKSCPECHKRKTIEPVFFAFTANIPNTLGSRADTNSDRMSADEKHHINKKNNEYKEGKAEDWIQTSQGMVHKDKVHAK